MVEVAKNLHPANVTVYCMDSMMKSPKTFARAWEGHAWIQHYLLCVHSSAFSPFSCLRPPVRLLQLIKNSLDISDLWLNETTCRGWRPLHIFLSIIMQQMVYQPQTPGYPPKHQRRISTYSTHIQAERLPVFASMALSNF